MIEKIVPRVGMRLRCMAAAAPNQGYVGSKGSVRKSLDDVRFTWWPDAQRMGYFVFDEEGWVMQELTEAPVAPVSSSYDHEAFERDLDGAINHIRLTASDELRAAQLVPQFEPGISMQHAVFTVCLTLVLRQLGQSGFADQLNQVLAGTREMLLAKNRAYGDSALNPVRVFSTASLKEQLLVRLDDKVSRLRRGSAAGEDVAQDLLGYLVLVAIAEKREQK